ncbi:MAG: amidohydrolase family protein [Clostridiales bacterium]|jgi:predicted TIM-barrel fold metal-dependent hydrolase|nr:amidohydrolase family protein [Clostridiales bacterium]
MIDFHAHIYPDSLAGGVIQKLGLAAGITGLMPSTDGTKTNTIKYFGENGVDKFVVLNIATREKQHKNVNDFAIELNKEPEIISFGSVYPTSDTFETELLRLKEAGIKGIKLHPEYQDFEINDKRAYRVYEMCRELDFIISFHAGYDLAYMHRLNCSAEKAREVVDDFPHNKFVFAHFGGYMIFDSVLEHLAGENVFFDTSFVSARDKEYIPVINKMINKHGAERFLFGSDTPWMHVKKSSEFIDMLDLSDSEKEKIFDKNAAELLGIDKCRGNAKAL